MSEQLIRSLPASRPRIGFAALLALALAGGFVAWVLIDRNEQRPGQSATAPSATRAPTTSAGPRIVTADGLSALAAARGHAVYWAGPRAKTVYEVTENAAGHVYIRYLPDDSQLGSPQANFLTVATYPRSDAYADIEAAALRPGAERIELPGGVLAVYDGATPTSVYFAAPGSKLQVEIFSPSALAARRLVEGGRVRPAP